MNAKYIFSCLFVLLVGCTPKTSVPPQTTLAGLEKGKGVYITGDESSSSRGLANANRTVTKIIAPYSTKIRSSVGRENLSSALTHAKESKVDYVYLLNVKKWKAGNPTEVDLGLSVYSATTGELLFEDRITRACGGKRNPSECLRPRLSVWAGDTYR